MPARISAPGISTASHTRKPVNGSVPPATLETVPRTPPLDFFGFVSVAWTPATPPVEDCACVVVVSVVVTGGSSVVCVVVTVCVTTGCVVVVFVTVIVVVVPATEAVVVVTCVRVGVVLVVGVVVVVSVVVAGDCCATGRHPLLKIAWRAASQLPEYVTPLIVVGGMMSPFAAV